MQSKHNIFLWLKHSAIAIAGTLIMFVLSIFIVYEQQKNSQEDIQEYALNTAKIVAIQSESILDNASAFLQDCSQRYMSVVGNEQESEILLNQFKQNITNYKWLKRVGIANSDGKILFNTDYNKTTIGNKSVEDREYFKSAKAGNKDVIFSEPLKTKIAGEWDIALAKRLENKDGKFLGVIYVLIPIERIGADFSKINLGKDGMINLRTQSLSQVVRYPEINSSTGATGNKNVSQTIKDLMEKYPDNDTYIYKAIAPIDKIERVYAYQKFSHSPFWMVVGISTQDISTNWKITAYILAFINILISILMFRLSNQIYIKNKTLEQDVKARTKELEIQKNRYEYLLKNSTDGIHILDEGGKIVECNQAFADMLGYTIEEAKRLKASDWDIDVSKKEENHIMHMFNEDRFFETLHKRKDGTILNTQVMVKSIEIDGIKYLYASSRDITNQKLLEKDYKNFFNSILYAMYILDLDKNIIDANEGFLKMHGFGKDEILNKNISIILDHEKNNIDEINAHFEKALLGEPQRFTIWAVHKNASSFPKEISIIKGKYLNRDAIIAIGIDISKQVSLEEDLRNINKSLKQLVNEEINKRMDREHLLLQQSRLAAMGEMIGNIAHQWRQPLNQISALKDLLVDDYKFNDLNDDKVDEFDRKITIGLQYMSQTIDDFRNFFKPDKEKREFDIKDSINATLSLINDSMKSSFININTDISDEKLTIYGYQSEFAQVLINILNNAKDILKTHNKDNNRNILIKAYKTSDAIFVEISDNGGGIPDAIIDKIFDPYFTTKHASQGTGLGLYMSKIIIEQNLGSKLNVENIQDGAKFIIELNS